MTQFSICGSIRISAISASPFVQVVHFITPCYLSLRLSVGVPTAWGQIRAPACAKKRFTKMTHRLTPPPSF